MKCLMTAELVYDAVEQWKAAGLSEEEACRNFAWLMDRIDAGDVRIPLATAAEAADLLELLESLGGKEAVGPAKVV